MTSKILFIFLFSLSMEQVFLQPPPPMPPGPPPPPPPPMPSGPPPPLPPRPPTTSNGCKCAQIVVSSIGEPKSWQPNAFTSYGLSSSHFNAFKSTVYRNSQSLTLTGGPRQFWRIHGGSRAGRIMIRNKYCKATCPNDCPAKWEVYQHRNHIGNGMYRKDPNIKFECKDGGDGSGDDEP